MRRGGACRALRRAWARASATISDGPPATHPGRRPLHRGHTASAPAGIQVQQKQGKHVENFSNFTQCHNTRMRRTTGIALKRRAEFIRKSAAVSGSRGTNVDCPASARSAAVACAASAHRLCSRRPPAGRGMRGWRAGGNLVSRSRHSRCVRRHSAGQQQPPARIAHARARWKRRKVGPRAVSDT